MRALTIALCLLATPALADVAGVASVIDGDTLEIHGQRIRFHGVDAPESRQLCRLDGKPWQCGKDAASALADKIARRPHHSLLEVVPGSKFCLRGSKTPTSWPGSFFEIPSSTGDSRLQGALPGFGYQDSESMLL